LALKTSLDPLITIVLDGLKIVDVVASARNFRRKEFRIHRQFLVRELPFNQVKSANAKGSAAGDFAAPGLPFSVACGPRAATRPLESESDLAGVGPGVTLELTAGQVT